MVEPYDLLLRAELGAIENLRLTVHTPADSIERSMTPSTIQNCSSVRGFERLVAHKYAKIQRIPQSEIQSGYVRAAMTRDKFTLLYGLADEEVADESYSPSPITTVHTLLQQVFDKKVQCASHTPQAEFEWWTGGAMQRFARSPLKEAIRHAKSNVHAHLRNGTELQFVYDVVGVTTPFEHLRYIIDAGIAPLEDISGEAFRRAYGIDRTLCFRESAKRVRVRSDWWSAVYGPL